MLPLVVTDIKQTEINVRLVFDTSYSHQRSRTALVDSSGSL